MAKQAKPTHGRRTATSSLRRIKSRAHVARSAQRLAKLGSQIRDSAALTISQSVETWVFNYIGAEPIGQATPFSDLSYGQPDFVNMARAFNRAFGANVNPMDFYRAVNGETVGDAVTYLSKQI